MCRTTGHALSVTRTNNQQTARLTHNSPEEILTHSKYEARLRPIPLRRNLPNQPLDNKYFSRDGLPCFSFIIWVALFACKQGCAATRGFCPDSDVLFEPASCASHTGCKQPVPPDLDEINRCHPASTRPTINQHHAGTRTTGASQSG